MTRRVLLIDDDSVQVRALALVLREYAIEAETAPTAEAALALFARVPAYHAIVVDAHLPGISGPELCRRLRQPRLVVLTGDVRILGQVPHADRVLLKPAGPESILRALIADDDSEKERGHA